MRTEQSIIALTWRYLNEEMRIWGWSSVISPTVTEDGLQVFVVRKFTNDLQSCFLEGSSPQTGDLKQSILLNKLLCLLSSF